MADVLVEPAVPPGPYMNEDGDWWVPVEGISFRAARAAVVSCLDTVFPLAYKGKEMAWLDSVHEGYCDAECSTNRQVLAYHFEEHRRD